MTDDEAIRRARQLVSRGEPWPGGISVPKFERIIASDDAFEARFIVPILLEIIDRRGLR